MIGITKVLKMLWAFAAHFVVRMGLINVAHSAVDAPRGRVPKRRVKSSSVTSLL